MTWPSRRFTTKPRSLSNLRPHPCINQPKLVNHSTKKMELILAPMDVAFGWKQQPQPASPPLGPASIDAKSSLVRLPSLFAGHKERASPRLVGMSDVLSASPPLERRVARLPSIDAMIRRDESQSPREPQPESLSPVQKQCLDLYKQLQAAPASTGDHALSALSQLADLQERRSISSPGDRKRRLDSMDDAASDRADKMRRPNSAKLCGMADCKKRAKAGGFCIAHGGGLRCSEEGCQKHAVSLGLCISHGGGKRCTVDGCMNASRKNGVCWSHGGKRLCKLEGCNKGPKSGGYCWSHGGKLKK